MSEKPSLPRKLERADSCQTFDSGAPELDLWIRKYSWENLRANNAITYVSTRSGRVVGYYAISAGGVELSHVPSLLKRGSRPDPMPVIVLGRLAVDREVQGVGVGAALLRDCLERSAVASEALGACALLVHARDSIAREFYLRHGEFKPSPLDEFQLMVSMKELRRIFL